MIGRRTLAALLLVAAAARASAQDPSHEWRSIRTAHFTVTFTPPLEPLARRVAADAERAYAQLAAELTPPRGPVDIVLTDDVDLSNGSATPVPTNRIVVYAAPPVGESALRYTNDWAQLVVTHELTHIFHLDRSRGVWRLAQHVFGRSPFLFPNLYSPSWLTEGLAVYYETRLTGQGRVEGAEHTLIARAAAVDHRLPRLGTISLADPRFPFGESAYAYGSLFVDYLARTRGPERVGRFIESESNQLVPYLIDIPARHAFGVSFTRAFGAWRDSVLHSVPGGAASPLGAWRELTADGASASFPRWLSDSSIVYTGAPGREVYGAFAVGLDGRRIALGRRNSPSANVPLAGGGLLFSQIEFTSPYQQRSDLFVQRGGRQTRLTHGARLTAPDARADGEIVAVEILPGGTRLVRVSRDGAHIVPLTSGGFDEQWSAPRWSARGDRIVAVRSLRGGISQIVVIDTTGAMQHVSVSGAVDAATPSWLAQDAGLLYTLGRDRSNEVIVDRFASGGTTDGSLPRYASQTFVLSSGSTGLFDPEPSRDGRRTAAALLRGDGYHIGVGDCCAGGTPVTLPRDLRPDPRTPAIAIDSSPSHPYRAWRTLYPRYWVPTIEPGFSSTSYRIGGATFGTDVVGRHALSATVLVPTDNTGLVGGLSYSYRGLGLPIVDVGGSQDWSWFRNIVEREEPKDTIGQVRRRIRDGALSTTWIRQRVRSSLSVTGSVGVEQRTYVTVPDGLFPRIDTAGTFDPAVFPRVVVGAGFANYRSPSWAVSPEDGVSASISVRERFRSGFTSHGDPSLSAVGVGAAYKALDLPGFSHHVVALRGALGWADSRANGYFEVGGTSGSAFEIIPGYSIGEGRRTFGVRGFVPGYLAGTRAYTVSAEYRAPLVLDRLGLGVLPFSLQKTSISLFNDYGSAWCPDVGNNRQVCVDPAQTARYSIASAGAELNVLAGLLAWDVPYRFRVGAAVPWKTAPGVALPGWTMYLTSGISY